MTTFEAMREASGASDRALSAVMALAIERIGLTTRTAVTMAMVATTLDEADLDGRERALMRVLLEKAAEVWREGVELSVSK